MKRRAVMLLCVLGITTQLLTGCGGSKYVEAENKNRDAGIEYMITGNYKEALKSFDKALENAYHGVGDLELDICYYKAEALYSAGDRDGAMALYSAIIDLVQASQAYFLRGNLYFAMGDFDAGKADYIKAADKDGKNYDLYIAIYENMARYGLADEGRSYLEKASKFGGKNAKALMQKGRIASLMGDTELAEKNLKDAIKGGEAAANFYLAQMYTSMGQTEEADTYFDAYLNSGKASGTDLMSLGENCMNSYDFASALRYLEAAVKLEDITNRQQLMRDIVIAYEYLGDFASAREEMEAYVKAYPDDFDAADELEFLKTR